MMTGSNRPDPAEALSDGVVTLPRLRHVWRLVTGAVVVLLLLGAAFVAGTLVRSPTGDALEVANQNIPVTASVEERVVANGLSIAASRTSGAHFDVVVTSAPLATVSSKGSADVATGSAAAERVVVTKETLTAGERASFGTLLGEVSGRPIFAVPPTLPLFRNLAAGDEGNDVRGIQDWLIGLGYSSVESTGRMDATTIRGLEAHYSSAGYRLPRGTDNKEQLAWKEFAAIPANDLPVLSAAATGAVLSSDAPLLRLQTSPPSLTALVTILERKQLTVGGPIGVSIGGGAPTASSVSAIGDFTTDEKTGVSGYPLTVAIPPDLVIPSDAPIQLVSLETPPPVLAVPAVALRQDGAKTYVLVDDGDGSSPSATAAVSVVVTAQAGGWAAIAPNPRLVAGTKVVVTP